MRNTERNKKTTPMPSSLANATTDNKGNYFNISNKPISANDQAKQSAQLLEKKKNPSNPYRLLDRSNKNNKHYHTTKPIAIEDQSNKKPPTPLIGKPKDSIEKYSNRTEYKTRSSSNRNHLEGFNEPPKKLYNENNDAKKVKRKITALTNAGNDQTSSNKGHYARSFIGKKDKNRTVNTLPGLHSTNSKSNSNIKVNDPIGTRKQLTNSKSNKTVKYYSMKSSLNKKLIIPKTTINMKEDKEDMLLNSSLEKENENNITSILYLLTKTNNFLGDSFHKFIEFFPFIKEDNDNSVAKTPDDVTDTKLLHLVKTNRKILNWNLAKSELFFDMNIIYGNIKELKERIDKYQPLNIDCDSQKRERLIDKESQLRVKQYNDCFSHCFALFKDLSQMLTAQIKENDIDFSKLIDTAIVINNNVDDCNEEEVIQVPKQKEQYEQCRNEAIHIEKQSKDSNNQGNNRIGNVNIISSVTNSNINVHVNVNLGNKKKSKRKAAHQQAKKLISKKKFQSEINEDVDDFHADVDEDEVSIGNGKKGINCPKANLFNVQKPKEENMKYKVYTSKSSFESSERDEKSVSKVVIGEIECYKDIIEQDKIEAFKSMRSKSSFNLIGKRRKEKNIGNCRILEDERLISDLDDDSWNEELNQEEINDEFNDALGSKSKKHLHLLPYHISKISFCKIFDEANGNVKLTEDYQNINLPHPRANRKKSLAKLRTKSKTFYINDKQDLEAQKNKECLIY